DGGRVRRGALPGVVPAYGFDGAAPPRVFQGHGSEIRDLAFLPDGTQLLSASFDGTVRRDWLSDGRSSLLVRHAGPVWSIALSPDGRRLASASEDRRVGVTELDGGAN